MVRKIEPHRNIEHIGNKSVSSIVPMWLALNGVDEICFVSAISGIIVISGSDNGGERLCWVRETTVDFTSSSDSQDHSYLRGLIPLRWD